MKRKTKENGYQTKQIEEKLNFIIRQLTQYFSRFYVNPFNGQCPSHIETSQLICRANQLTGFYVRRTLTVKWLKRKKCIRRIFSKMEYRISSQGKG